MNDLEDSPSEAAELGTSLEPYVLDQAEQRLGTLVRDMQVKCDGLPLVANLDAVLAATNEPVEAKTSGLLGGFHQRSIWGDQGTADVPDYVALQVHAQLTCCPQRVTQAHVQAFLGGRGNVWYVIPRDDWICKSIRDMVVRWWDRHIIDGTAPTNPPSNLDMLKRIQRMPDKIAENIDSALAVAYEEARDAHKTTKVAKEAAQAKLIAALGDAEWGRLDDGRMVKFVMPKGERFDYKRYSEEHPDHVKAYMVPGGGRTLYILKAK
jgi:predicted phage-related endonuclease